MGRGSCKRLAHVKVASARAEWTILVHAGGRQSHGRPTIAYVGAKACAARVQRVGRSVTSTGERALMAKTQSPNPSCFFRPPRVASDAQASCD